MAYKERQNTVTHTANGVLIHKQVCGGRLEMRVNDKRAKGAYELWTCEKGQECKGSPAARGYPYVGRGKCLREPGPVPDKDLDFDLSDTEE
jgi:hypothetical protein